MSDPARAPVPVPPLHVVGIGASAGGLDAIERFFDNVPKNTGMAFVIVQHLSPDFKSMMDELLARHTQLPIALVEDGMLVEADHVYLIPSKKEMIIAGGRLRLSEQDRQQERTLPIDVFFRSLARDCGRRSVAIVLSGGGTDGSRGILDVHRVGGLVVVQDVESAQFDGMPRTAVDSGAAHAVVTPEEMPRILVQHAAAPMTKASGEPALVDSSGVGAVYRMLQEEFGIDFTHYKPSTVTRRIERRLALARSQDIDEYVRRLKADRKELDVLYRDLLIEVTRFFRDDQAFRVLEEQVFPALLQREPRDVPLRFWVAGCATGEEAYSLAILLQDMMATFGQRPVKIFATDVHRGSLEHATRACYGKEAVAGVSPDRLARYFTKQGEGYQVVPDVRQMVVFAQHNVIKDAPFTRVDLISCRNLLIYLQPAAQQKVLSLFHFALNRAGILFLGPSETVGPVARGYETIDKHWRVYRKRHDTRIPVDTRVPPVVPADARVAVTPIQAHGSRYSLAQLLGTYDALLERVMPPSLLVGEKGDLIHAFAGAGRFLHHRDGRQGLDLVDLVDPDLKMVLVGGLKRALGDPSPMSYRNVKLTDSDGERPYKVTIQRVTDRNSAGPHLLVSFEATETAGSNAAPSPQQVEIDQGTNERLRVMESELHHTKENLQSAIEELEASNEELQSSNEELQTSNEELQSTNEELQSVNEELYTVNAEYQRKIAELTELTNDMDNLLSSTDIGTIFLDRQLKIRKFTPQVAESFSLLPHDVGRSIEIFAHKMNHPELVQDLRGTLESGQPVEREVRDASGQSFFLRILPYRAKGAINGVVLTLIDVSSMKAAEDALFHERYLLNGLLGSVPDAIYFKDGRGKFIRINQAMAVRLGLGAPELAVGKTALELPDQVAALEVHKQDEAVLRTGKAEHYKLQRRLLADGVEAWDQVTRLPLRDRNNQIVGIIGIFRDVTEQKRAEQNIQDGVRRRDQFLAMLSHELRNPLGAIVTASALLKSERSSPQKSGRFLDILDRQSEQMAHLLDDLLEASRVTQNKIELKIRAMDLRSVVKDAVDSVSALMESRGVRFTVEIDAEPIWVDGDPSRLQQIQANLLSNAAKYTPKGGHVVLSARREEGAAVIRVKDDGPGIPQEMIDSIFDLFVQSKRTLDRSAGGLGVGLTLVRSLVSMHGGTVTVHSDGEGKGSEFVVRLPLTSKPAAGEPAPVPARRRPRVREGARIVIVEDSADSRDLLCELLAHQGFQCATAEHGAAGLALIDEVRPEIAILDVGLPEMDGFQLARRLRGDAEHADMFLIALTGYGQASDRVASREAGFDEHLVKPVNVDELLRLMAELRGASTSEDSGPHAGHGATVLQ